MVLAPCHPPHGRSQQRGRNVTVVAGGGALRRHRSLRDGGDAPPPTRRRGSPHGQPPRHRRRVDRRHDRHLPHPRHRRRVLPVQRRVHRRRAGDRRPAQGQRLPHRPGGAVRGPLRRRRRARRRAGRAASRCTPSSTTSGCSRRGCATRRARCTCPTAASFSCATSASRPKSDTLRLRLGDDPEFDLVSERSAEETVRDLAGSENLTEVIFVGDVAAQRRDDGDIEVEVKTTRPPRSSGARDPAGQGRGHAARPALDAIADSRRSAEEVGAGFQLAAQVGPCRRDRPQVDRHPVVDGSTLERFPLGETRRAARRHVDGAEALPVAEEGGRGAVAGIPAVASTWSSNGGDLAAEVRRWRRCRRRPSRRAGASPKRSASSAECCRLPVGESGHRRQQGVGAAQLDGAGAAAQREEVPGRAVVAAVSAEARQVGATRGRTRSRCRAAAARRAACSGRGGRHRGR